MSLMSSALGQDANIRLQKQKIYDIKLEVMNRAPEKGVV